MKTRFNEQRNNHGPKSKIGCAIFLIILGFLLLAFNLGWIPIQYKGLIISWQMLLVVVGLGSISKKHYTGGIFLLCIALYFMLPLIDRTFPGLLGVYPINFKAYWPILLIAGGIFFLVKKSKKTTFLSEYTKERKERILNDADYVDKSTIFNSSEQIIFSSNFSGGDINVMFGELILDLRKVTQITSDSLLEINVMFGSVIVYTPENWFLEMKTSTLFGNIEDKRNLKQNSMLDIHQLEPDQCEFILKLEGNCMFGSIEIRN